MRLGSGSFFATSGALTERWKMNSSSSAPPRYSMLGMLVHADQQ